MGPETAQPAAIVPHAAAAPARAFPRDARMRRSAACVA